MADETDKKPDPLADELLQMGSFGDAAPAMGDPAPASSAADGGLPDLGELEALLKQAAAAQAGSGGGGGMGGGGMGGGIDRPAQTHASVPLPSTLPFDLPAFEQAISDAQAASIDLLRDVELNVKIELGRSKMLVEDVLKLAEGSVVELDKLAGDPVDVFVNDKLVARGEVLVLNDNFCVRVNEIMAAAREEV